jgi:hypothetical protein
LVPAHNKAKFYLLIFNDAQPLPGKGAEFEIGINWPGVGEILPSTLARIMSLTATLSAKGIRAMLAMVLL